MKDICLIVNESCTVMVDYIFLIFEEAIFLCCSQIQQSYSIFIVLTVCLFIMFCERCYTKLFRYIISFHYHLVLMKCVLLFLFR